MEITSKRKAVNYNLKWPGYYNQHNSQYPANLPWDGAGGHLSPHPNSGAWILSINIFQAQSLILWSPLPSGSINSFLESQMRGAV